jgi:hypothetical protein
LLFTAQHREQVGDTRIAALLIEQGGGLAAMMRLMSRPRRSRP